MILNSIKWRLQLWYGLILLGVLAGFGFTAYKIEQNRQWRRVDAELQRRIVHVQQAWHPPGMGMQPRPRNAREPQPAQPYLGPPKELWATNLMVLFRENRLTQLQSALFNQSDRDGYYYIILTKDGHELARSSNAPPVAGFLGMQIIENLPKMRRPPPTANQRPPLPERNQTPGRMDGHFREVAVMSHLESAEITAVGRSVASELRELRITALWLTAVGGGVLLVGLAGGWWIVKQAMRPIADISNAATRIAAGDLSKRINIADTESELGRLAGVLNSTFSRLEASFAQQRQFTADAAHELRTPVAVMLTQTQAALNRERSAGEYKETVEACERASQRMRQLTESLLELARLDAGQEALQCTEFDLSRALSESLEMIRPLAESRGVRLRHDIAPLRYTGDAGRIAQVITNLLTNAVDYSKPDGWVLVSLAEREGAVVLTVTDTGVGIPAADLPQIFRRFYRVDKSRSAGHAGLGLAICKAIVEAHGGTIDVSSTVKEGTTFTVRLPVA